MDAGVELVQRPRRRRGLGRDSMVSPVLEEVNSRVVDMVKVGREIGAPTEVVHKGFPGFGILEIEA